MTHRGPVPQTPLHSAAGGMASDSSGLISQGAGPHFTSSVLIVTDHPPACNPHAPPLTGIAGRRLRTLMGLRIDAETMYRLFDCAYLYKKRPLRWNPELAAGLAFTLGSSSPASLLVLIGERVQDAFGFPRGFRLRSRKGQKCSFVVVEYLVRKPLALLVPPLTTYLLADHRLCNRVEHGMKLVLRVAKGEPLADVLCTQHGTERMPDEEKGPDRRVYECGCEVLR